MIWDGRYEIERTLGEGGMGEVLLARDLARGGRPVAIKVLRPEFHDITPTFLTEYTLQRSLRHPGVPQVYDFGFAASAGREVPYFVMEYVAGIPLNELLDPLPPLDLVWLWTIHVLRVLDRMHRLGFVHRDLKPGNILVDPAAADAGVHLIDYGIAVRAGAPAGEYFVGTPEYCAPEVLANEPCDGRADLYALGLVLFELIDGAPPWAGHEPDELYLARMTTAPRELLVEDVPDEVEALVLQLLAPNPRDRPGSAAEVLVRLADATGLPPIIETADALQMGLEASVLYGEAYRDVSEGTAPIIALELAPGRRGRALVHEIGDQRAVRGVRVVRIELEADDIGGPVAQLAPALDVFRRLRAERGAAPLELPGIAGAATMLSRMHGPTLFIIEQLQRADASTLALIDTVFTDAGNYQLRILATHDPSEEPRAPERLARLLDRRFVQRVGLPNLAEEQAARWVGEVLQAAPPTRAVRAWYQASSGGRTRLIHQIVQSFKRGDIERGADGYRFSGEAWAPPAGRIVHGPDAAAAAVIRDELADLVSALRSPVPFEVAETFFGGLRLRALLDEGVVIESPSSWVARHDQAEHAARWQRLPPKRRQELAQRLADAIARGADHPGRASVLADIYQLTERPAQAVPSLMRAADEAIASDDEERAAQHIARARALVAADQARDDVGQAWRVRLVQTEVRLARRFHRVDALEVAADAMFELGVDAAHLPTMRQGLYARLDHGVLSARWERLRADAWTLLELNPGGPTPDDEAMSRWAQAWHAWATGDVTTALALADQAATAAELATAAVQLTAYALRAEIAVAERAERVTAVALRSYRHAAERAKDRAHLAQAAVFAARHARVQGQHSRSLALVERASTELGAYYGKRVNALIELELARCHLELGWWPTAATHAERAVSLAAECEPRLRHLAEIERARALTAQGEAVRARDLVRALVDAPPPHCMPSDRHAAACASLEARYASGGDPEAIIAAGVALARAAQETQDGYWSVRAATIATRVALEHGAPLRAVKLSDWLRDASATSTDAAIPLHLVRALRAQAHYRMKWFGSAKVLSHSAMEALRAAAERIRNPKHRKDWLAVPDNQIVGLATWGEERAALQKR